MSRSDFMEEMAWWEIRRAVSGIRRRGRSLYDANRMLGWMVMCALGGKAESPTDLLKFSWEQPWRAFHAAENGKSARPEDGLCGMSASMEDDAALEALRKEVEEYNARIDNKKNDN